MHVSREIRATYTDKTALYELNCRLLEACQIGGLEGKTC
jgi:hypothetical protein